MPFRLPIFTFKRGDSLNRYLCLQDSEETLIFHLCAKVARLVSDSAILFTNKNK